MSLNRVDFDNVEVTNATNPSIFGYHHGPITNPNDGWDPGSRTVTVALNASAPNAGAVLSGFNIGVCDIVVNGDEMCGTVYTSQPSLRRHIRTAHPGALTNPPRTNIPLQEEIAGKNAIKLFVLSGGWRDARYVYEPGRGPVGGWLDQYATACERIAAADAGFAARYGTRFHREPVASIPPSAGRRNSRKRGPPVPERRDISLFLSPSASRGENTANKRRRQI